MGKLSKLVGAAAVLGATICGAAYYKKKHGMTVTHDSDFEDDLVVDMKQGKKVIDISTEGSDAQNKKVTLTFNTENAKKAVSDTLDTIGDAMEVAKYKIVDVIGEDNVEEAKEKVNNVKNKVVDTIGEENINKAKATLSDATDKAKATISDVADKAKDKADEIFTEENIELAKEKMSDAFEKTKDTIKKAGEKVADMVSDKDNSNEIVINSEDVIISDDSEDSITTEADAETSSTPIESVNNFDEDLVGDEDLDSINTIDDELSYDTMDTVEDSAIISDSNDYESDTLVTSDEYMNEDLETGLEEGLDISSEAKDSCGDSDDSFEHDELQELDELEDEDSLAELDSFENLDNTEEIASFENHSVSTTDSSESNPTVSNVYDNSSDDNDDIIQSKSFYEDYNDSNKDTEGNDCDSLDELDELSRLEAELKALEAAAEEDLIDDFDVASTEIEKDYSSERYSFLDDEIFNEEEYIDDLDSDNSENNQEASSAYTYKTPSFLIDDTAEDYVPTSSASDLDIDDLDELDDELLADFDKPTISSLSNLTPKIDANQKNDSISEDTETFDNELEDNFETKEDDQVIEFEEVDDSGNNGQTNSSPISDSHKYDFLADELDEF